jgi:hypothetical protein
MQGYVQIYSASFPILCYYSKSAILWHQPLSYLHHQSKNGLLRIHVRAQLLAGLFTIVFIMFICLGHFDLPTMMNAK